MRLLGPECSRRKTVRESCKVETLRHSTRQASCCTNWWLQQMEEERNGHVVLSTVLGAKGRLHQPPCLRAELRSQRIFIYDRTKVHLFPEPQPEHQLCPPPVSILSSRPPSSFDPHDSHQQHLPPWSSNTVVSLPPSQLSTFPKGFKHSGEIPWLLLGPGPHPQPTNHCPLHRPQLYLEYVALSQPQPSQYPDPMTSGKLFNL